MKVAVGVLFCTILGIWAHCYALDYVVIKCNTEGRNCPALPVAPALPMPPSPPPPPSVAVPPMPPTPVAPPLPSSIPEINVAAQAHLACVGKAEGTEITWEYENKSSMAGTCGKRNGKPYLKLSHVFISN